MRLSATMVTADYGGNLGGYTNGRTTGAVGGLTGEVGDLYLTKPNIDISIKS
jgi:hypothetical protein